MPSFDIVCEANMVKIKNGVDVAAKEINNRFDFKGTSASLALKDKEITLIGDAEFQIQQIEDVLRAKLTKQEVDVRFLEIGSNQKIGGDKVKCIITIRNGIATEDAKKIQRHIKDSKIKVQVAIQGEALRVSSSKRDDLQACIAIAKKEFSQLPLEFNNFRD